MTARAGAGESVGAVAAANGGGGEGGAGGEGGESSAAAWREPRACLATPRPSAQGQWEWR